MTRTKQLMKIVQIADSKRRLSKSSPLQERRRRTKRMNKDLILSRCHRLKMSLSMNLNEAMRIK